MNIVAMGDAHLRASVPENRTDDFIDAMWEKLNFVLGVYQDSALGSILLIPGDLFDKHNVPYSVVEKAISAFSRGTSPVQVGVVFGQHDQRYHTSLKTNTPLGCLAAAYPNTFHILGEEPWIVKAYDVDEWREVHIYGAGWGEDVPNILDAKAFNVLVTHRMIINEHKLWEAQEDYEDARGLLAKKSFSLIVSGDNHQGFFVRSGRKFLVNAGSLMRSGVNQLDHVPSVYVYDLSAEKVEQIRIPVRPSAEVFDIAGVEEAKEEDERLQQFVAELKVDSVESLNFKANVMVWMKKNTCRPGVKAVIEEILK